MMSIAMAVIGQGVLVLSFPFPLCFLLSYSLCHDFPVPLLCPILSLASCCLNYDTRRISIEFISSNIGVNACFMQIFGFYIVE